MSRSSPRSNVVDVGKLTRSKGTEGDHSDARGARGAALSHRSIHARGSTSPPPPPTVPRTHKEATVPGRLAGKVAIVTGGNSGMGNLGSCFLGLKYVTAIMKQQGGGSIINNGSTAGVTTDGSGPVYKLDLAVQRFVDAWMSFPDLLLLLTVMTIIGQGIPQIIGMLGLSLSDCLMSGSGVTMQFSQLPLACRKR